MPMIGCEGSKPLPDFAQKIVFIRVMKAIENTIHSSPIMIIGTYLQAYHPDAATCFTTNNNDLKQGVHNFTRLASTKEMSPVSLCKAFAFVKKHVHADRCSNKTYKAQQQRLFLLNVA